MSLSLRYVQKTLSHLQQTVSHQRDQQLVAVALADQGSVLRGVHTGEVKHSDVRLTVMVHGEVKDWQLVIGGEVCSLPGVSLQSLLVHVPSREELLGVWEVLKEDRCDIFIPKVRLSPLH